MKISCLLRWHISLLPFLARPIASREFRFFLVAFVTSAERFAPFRVRLLNPHVRVAKTHQLYCVAFFGEDSEFLRFAGGAFGFVVTGEAFSAIIYGHRFT